MLKITKGNIFKSNADIIVIIDIDKKLHLQFKRLYSDIYKDYIKNKKLFIYKLNKDIENNLDFLVSNISQLNIRSVAILLLECNKDELWLNILSLVVGKLYSIYINNVDVYIYKSLSS